ncbi:MAG: Uma2 family endonuclease [Polyangiaceae bacterium]|nr:Uma2 family endonuclease [Polyangiaceae bacterium]
MSMVPPEESPHSPGKQPAVDERLVAPESRYEIHDGRVRYVSPADEPHGTRHSKISALLEAYVKDAYDVASDMLTRTSESDDMAPDASVFPSERDPVTGGRRLEEVVFEVLNTESLSHSGQKASKLSKRGVRRIFAVDVERKRAFEWSLDLGTWSILALDGVITDQVFVAPLPISALVQAAKADDAVAAALLAKGNRILERALSNRESRGKAEGKTEGKTEGKRAALLTVLSARGFSLSLAEKQRLEAATEVQLDAWLSRAATSNSAADLFG